MLKETSYIRRTSHITSRDDLLMGAACKDEDLLELEMHNANGLKTKEVKCIYYFNLIICIKVRRRYSIQFVDVLVQHLEEIESEDTS